MKAKHPMQPIVWAKDGVIRFKENKIIDYLFRSGKMNLNELAVMDFPVEDRVQIAQLLGYSVSGFGDLSYVPRRIVKECDEIAAKMSRKRHRPAQKTEGKEASSPMSDHKLTGDRDLAMDYDLRPYIGELVTFLRLTKAGLAYVKTHDGKFISVPLRNLEPKPSLNTEAKP